MADAPDPGGCEYIVGEDRPELFRPVTKGMVHRVPISEGGSVDDLVPAPEQDGGSTHGG